MYGMFASLGLNFIGFVYVTVWAIGFQKIFDMLLCSSKILATFLDYLFEQLIFLSPSLYTWEIPVYWILNLCLFKLC